MQRRQIRFWIVVLAGVITLSGGVPLSIHHSVAQPFPSDAIKGAAPLGHALELSDQSIERALKKRNRELEQLKGRKLEESEKVKLVRRVVLQPHPDSPVKDVIIIAYELSDGSVGQQFAGPLVDANVKGPLGWHTEAINLDEGWYIVRYKMPEELESLRKATDTPAEPVPSPAVKDKPLSLLERVLGLFSPSAALACSGGCTPFPSILTHSVSQLLTQQVTPSIFVLVAEDGVKLTYVQRDAQTCSPKIVAVPPPLCHTEQSWMFDSPCNPTSFTQLAGAVTATHSDTYRSPGGAVRVDLTSMIWANEFFIMPFGECVFTLSQPSNLRCENPMIDRF